SAYFTLRYQVIPISGKVLLPFAGSTSNIAAKLDLGVHIPMFLSNDRSKLFVPRATYIWDDNCAALELKKSILKKADYKIGLTYNRVVWNMGTGSLIGFLHAEENSPIRHAT